jgi:hypothetical protein
VILIATPIYVEVVEDLALVIAVQGSSLEFDDKGGPSSITEDKVEFVAAYALLSTEQGQSFAQ